MATLACILTEKRFGSPDISPTASTASSKLNPRVRIPRPGGPSLTSGTRPGWAPELDADVRVPHTANRVLLRLYWPRLLHRLVGPRLDTSLGTVNGLLGLRHWLVCVPAAFLRRWALRRSGFVRQAQVRQWWHANFPVQPVSHILDTCRKDLLFQGPCFHPTLCNPTSHHVAESLADDFVEVVVELTAHLEVIHNLLVLKVGIV